MSDGDLHEMYKRYKKRSDILLWIKQSTKRPRLEASASQQTSKYETQVNKMTEIDDICDKLCKKHGERYTKEQTRAWAVLIHMGKHDCYESPPDKHFFKVGKSRSATSGVGVSPGKRLNMRSECIDQLEKWHRLMEKGAITSEQYKDIQDSILSDIKKM